MALTKLGTALNIIAGLGTTPQERALTTEEFKAKFDEAAGIIKTYLNSTLTTEIDTALGVFSGITASPAELNILDGALITTTELNYLDNVTGAIQGQLDGLPLVQSVSNTASKTLAITDKNTLQACDHASVAISIIIPPNSTVSFPIGTQIAFSRDGVADVSVALGAGVTITNTTKLKIANQGESMALLKTGTDTWKLFGSLKA